MNQTIAIDAYLRKADGSLQAGRAAVSYDDLYHTGRNRWRLAGTIVELGRTLTVPFTGIDDIDQGRALDMAPLIIPAREVRRMAEVQLDIDRVG